MPEGQAEAAAVVSARNRVAWAGWVLLGAGIVVASVGIVLVAAFPVLV